MYMYIYIYIGFNPLASACITWNIKLKGGGGLECILFSPLFTTTDQRHRPTPGYKG